MADNNVILRFENVSYSYDNDFPILDDASFSIRENTKVTIMGQNGAGKSTLLKLILGEAQPNTGKIHKPNGATVAIGRQVMPLEWLDDSVRDFFAHAFEEVPYTLDKQIADVLEIVNFSVPLEKIVRDCSGGQQARLLLAFALIQDPDILLLDEPTNNLDRAGIDHLTGFLMMYEKTVIVISHDAEFLNAFTEAVLHLDVYTHKTDMYMGNYFDVLDEIAARLERDRMKNARLLKEAQDRKDKINFFANKGGKMRRLASKLRDQAEEAEENMVDVKRDDKTIKDFTLPAQEFTDVMVTMTEVKVIKNHEPHQCKVDIKLRRKHKLLVSGTNGIGKSTLLRALAGGNDPALVINPDVRVGYYKQDFSGLDFSQTAYDSLGSVMGELDNELLRTVAAQFLLTGDILKNKVGSLSEGQKGLLCFARFVLQKPGLLILDEPTNHINFRHLPVIARAINDFQGCVIMVSHAPDFVKEITFTDELDLTRLA